MPQKAAASDQGFFPFWKHISLTQKITLLCAASFVVLLPFYLMASQSPTRTTPKASGGATPTSPFKPTDTSMLPTTLDEAITTKGVFVPQDQPLGQIGLEKITNKDLNAALYLKYYSTFVNPGDIPSLRTKIKNEILNDSVMLQAAKNNPQTFGNIDLTDILLNDTKDYNQRNSVLMEIQTVLNTNVVEKISGARLSIWYHNVALPTAYPTLADARSVTQSKIQTIHDALAAGTLTFSQAAQQIKADTSLEGIDPNYTGNALYEFTDKSPDKIIFGRPDIKSEVLNLSPGGISSVFEITSSRPGPVGEEYFTIWTITGKTNSTTGNLDSWLNTQKQTMNITIN